MYAEQQGEGARQARWLADREQRIQALEAENRELRQQLERLRQGVGIALVIEGRVVPVAPSSPGIIASAPVPAVAPTQPRPAAQPIPRPVTPPPPHATGAHPIPHWASQQASRPTYPPLAETPAQLPVVGPLTPTGPVSAIGKWNATPPRAASAPSPAPRPEPRWFEEASAPPAREDRDGRDDGDGSFLL